MRGQRLAQNGSRRRIASNGPGERQRSTAIIEETQVRLRESCTVIEELDGGGPPVTDREMGHRPTASIGVRNYRNRCELAGGRETEPQYRDLATGRSIEFNRTCLIDGA